MTLIDANVLLYVVDADSPMHLTARHEMDRLCNSGQPVGLAWIVLLAFLRISTKSSIFQHPLSVNDALDIVAGWLSHPMVQIVEPSTKHFSILRNILTHTGTGGNLTSDAHLAALAIANDAGY